MLPRNLLASIFFSCCCCHCGVHGFELHTAPLATHMFQKRTPPWVHLDVAQTSPKEHGHNNNRLLLEKPQLESKRQMLFFCLPTLGIFLTNPLMSNIDNAFIGKTVGTQGLAALSPATLWTDQLLYFFSFLGSATTRQVSKAYASGKDGSGDTVAARQAASAPLSAALLCGLCLTTVYMWTTPRMVAKVDPSLQHAAASYIYWRGSIAWVALCQRVLLSMQLATRDSVTPLKIVGLAALINVVGDALFCVAPFQWGCAGAAAATAVATVFSSAVMLCSLKRKELLPSLQFPTRTEWWGLLQFAAPVIAVTLTRMSGSISMQKAAATLGVQPMAAYQLACGLLYFFMLFGSPLNQLSQTRLPALLEAAGTSKANHQRDDHVRVLRATCGSILSLAAVAAGIIGGCAGLALGVGPGLFTSDLAVQALARQSAPAVFGTVAMGVFTVAVDGAMLAAKDFGFMLWQGILSLLLQLALLKKASFCSSVSMVFATFALRLGSYSFVALLRTALGYGKLGQAMRYSPSSPPMTTKRWRSWMIDNTRAAPNNEAPLPATG